MHLSPPLQRRWGSISLPIVALPSLDYLRAPKGLLSLLALLLVWLVPAHQPYPYPKTMAGQWSEQLSQAVPAGDLSFFPGSTSPGLAPSREGLGVYTSAPKRADLPFNAVGLQWKGDLPYGKELRLEVRGSQDGKAWSPWYSTEEVDQFRGEGAHATDLVFVRGQFLQYRALIEGERPDLLAALEEITVTYIDSTAGPNLAWAQASSLRRIAAAGVQPPPLITRAGWGANEGYRFYRNAEVWPPEYTPMSKIILHHTATSNDEDPTVAMRAIYYYHAVTLGWGDIGYNVVVDRLGNVYEGRFGGENAVGGHAYRYNWGSIGIAIIGTYQSVAVSSQAEASLLALLTYKATRHGIDPLGSSYFVDKELPNIMGHRDALNTSCPGAAFYERLPSVRAQIRGGLPPYGQAWLGYQGPRVMSAGARQVVPVELRNSGTTTWTVSAPTPFRLGYRWFLVDGKPYTVEQDLEYHTQLPKEVATWETVTVPAQLRVPSKPGNYILRWDMVHEQVTWFSDQGSPTLEASILVPSPTTVFLPLIQAGMKTIPEGVGGVSRPEEPGGAVPP